MIVLVGGTMWCRASVARFSPEFMLEGFFSVFIYIFVLLHVAYMHCLCVQVVNY
uniref:Uncharacterized protein n=1 Tax=Arundo donax TaxID=35708 RepID=A0A0A9GGC8_ARUDO